jgi:hypothetical protein
MRISLERSILIAEQFLQELIKKYGKNPVSTDGWRYLVYIHRLVGLEIASSSSSSSSPFLLCEEHHYRERTMQYMIKEEPNALMTTIFLA